VSPGVHALARFWWLVVAGLIVGGGRLAYSAQHGTTWQ
jgi:hypothetical protein